MGGVVNRKLGGVCATASHNSKEDDKTKEKKSRLGSHSALMDMMTLVK